MLSILGFFIILGPLVIVHELGHFLFARLFNVKAEIFSIGFGPKLWSRQIGETEWRVSAIPMGGYVKLLGEDPEVKLSVADQARALQKQAPWKRFFIFFGGPFFNFLWAALVFMAIMLIGEPQMASVIGRVVQNSHAEKAGFLSGDVISKVNGTPVKKYEEVMNIISENPEKELAFEVTQASASRVVKATPHAQEGFSVYGETTHVGEIEGLLPAARATQIGVSNPESPAGKAGLKTLDKLSRVNGKAVSTWEELEKSYDLAPKQTLFALEFERPSEPSKVISVQWAKPAAPQNSLGTHRSFGQDFGLYSSEMFIEKTVSKSPAAEAGIKSGDRILSVSGKLVTSFFEMKDAVQRAGEKDGKILLSWERDGKIMASTMTPTATTSRDPLLKKVTQYTVGIMPMLVWAEPVTLVERTWNPFVLVYKGFERMVVFSWRNLVSIQKMFSGDVSVNTLGGPIMIGKIAGESISRGLISFLTTMAVLSIGLGVLNILPIPVLDGGHLLLLGLEMIRGKALTIRQMEVLQQVGLSLILLLMVIVMRNDISRLPFFE